VPALPPYIFEPICQQFSALLPEREVDHPLGCHRPRIPDRVVFEKLVQVLALGSSRRQGHPARGSKRPRKPPRLAAAWRDP
jgi:hypothetical protein